MSAHSHTDFILPGDHDPLALFQAIGAILLAFDMIYNRRRLEAMLHALRNAHLVSLVADRHDLVVVPQMVIYHTEDGDTNLSSSVSTQAEKDAPNVKPDFCILHLPFRERYIPQGNLLNPSFLPTSILDWRKFQLDSAFIPIIEEDKRPISRAKLSMEVIRLDLVQALEEGCSAADTDAKYLWQDPRRARQKRVILLSSIGLWWMFKLAQRPPGMDPGSNPMSDPTWEEDADEQYSEERTEAQDLAELEQDEEEAQGLKGIEVEPDLDEDLTLEELSRGSKRKAYDDEDDDDDAVDSSTVKRTRTVSPNRDAKKKNVPKFRSIDITDVDPAHNAENDPEFEQIQEVVVDNAQDAWPPIEEWSGLIHMGTPASNQRLWLIHDWLQTFSTDPECVDLDLQDNA